MVGSYFGGYHNQCAGKEAFPSGADAAKAKERITKRHATRHRCGLDIYRCRHCGLYHLGNPVRTNGKELRKAKRQFVDKHPHLDV